MKRSSLALILLLGIFCPALKAEKTSNEVRTTATGIENSDRENEDQEEELDPEELALKQLRDRRKHKALSFLYGVGLTTTLGALAISLERLINSESMIKAAKNKLETINENGMPDGEKIKLLQLKNLLSDGSGVKWFYFPVTIGALSYCCYRLAVGFKDHLKQTFAKKAVIKKNTDEDGDEEDDDEDRED